MRCQPCEEEQIDSHSHVVVESSLNNESTVPVCSNPLPRTASPYRTMKLLPLFIAKHKY